MIVSSNLTLTDINIIFYVLYGSLTQLVQSATLTRLKSQVRVLQEPHQAIGEMFRASITIFVQSIVVSIKSNIACLIWRVGREVDCTGLENQRARERPGGSNPSPSAREVLLLLDFRPQRKVDWRLHNLQFFGAVADVVIAAD